MIITYEVWRHGSNKGRAGVFYSFEKRVPSDKRYELKINSKDVLEINYPDVEPFLGLPSEYLMGKWDMFDIASGLGEEAISDGEVMDIIVAIEAKKRGYDAINYGGEELQYFSHLTQDDLEANLEDSLNELI